ncbi:hypothetical protein KY362_05845 [Candidatus Woesearchaeota archaeon]|nr:hypothetical protein [Candidatus Woesearchaeota archaeon]
MPGQITEKHISRIKVYEERLNLRRLMHLQMEIADKKKWLEGYESEPNPYLEQAAANVRYRLEWLEKEIRSTTNKLSPETLKLIE